jgi:ATP/maltotriose-dependent transcriptional regulator MalT
MGTLLPQVLLPQLSGDCHLCEQMQNQALQGMIMTRLGEAYLMRGDVEQSHDLARQGLALTRNAQYSTGIVMSQRALGRLALARGALAQAESHFQEALQHCASTQRPYLLGGIHLDLARLAYAKGNSEAVTTYLHEAHVLCSALRIPKRVEHTTQLARELGVSLPVP